MYHKTFKNGIIFAVFIWLLNMLCLYFMGRFSGNAYVYWCVGVIPAAAVVVITCLQNHDIRDLGFYPDHLACDGIVMSCMLIVITDSINASGFRDQLAA